MVELGTHDGLDGNEAFIAIQNTTDLFHWHIMLVTSGHALKTGNTERGVNHVKSSNYYIIHNNLE